MKAMETAGGAETSGLIMEEILPPRIEDAGLEDSALPLEAIQEAFLKAASAIGSLETSALTSNEEDEDDDGDEEEEAEAGSEAAEESSDRTGDPPPAARPASDAVTEIEPPAEAGGTGGTATRQPVDDDGEGCAVGLQKLEIR